MQENYQRIWATVCPAFTPLRSPWIFRPYSVSQIQIFLDLPDYFDIGQSEFFLDDQWFQRRRFLIRWEFIGIQVFSYMPWNNPGKFYPSVIWVEFAAKEQMKVFEWELLKLWLIHTMMISTCKVFETYSGFFLHKRYEKCRSFHYYKITYTLFRRPWLRSFSFLQRFFTIELDGNRCSIAPSACLWV